MRYITFILLLTGCGANYTPPSDVQPYVAEFMAAVGRSVQVQWGFGSLGYDPNRGGVIGQCSLPSPTVTLDQRFWDAADATQRELLVLHELGHCVLYRDHLTAYIPNSNLYVSIMDMYQMSDDQFDTQPSYYLKELSITAGVPLLNGGVAGDTVHKCSVKGVSNE